MAVSKYYKEFNPNPLGKEAGDCTVRALCAVTGKDWYTIYDVLTAIGRKQAIPFPCIKLHEYDYYVEIFDAKRYKVKRERGKKALNVERFCKEHPTGKYILRLAHHKMGIVNGEYYELVPGWEKSTVYTYWEF